MEFFRFCPECGRRFHIKLVSRKRLRLDRTVVSEKSAVRVERGTAPYGRPVGRLSGLPQSIVTVEEGKPTIMEIEEFEYNYKCKHCGHEWAEKHTTQR